MPNNIACPNCKTKIDPSVDLWEQLSLQIRTELEFEFHNGRAAIYKARRELIEQQALLEADRRSLDKKIQDEVERVRNELVAEAKEKATKSFELEFKVRDQQAIDLRKKLQAAQEKERKRPGNDRELESRSEELQFNVEQQLELEREKVRQQAVKQYVDKQEQKDAEHRQLIGDLRRQIGELKRNADQGFAMLQSEDKEQVIEDMLLAAFPLDSIEPMHNGIAGVDSIHRVHFSDGTECGSILWDSKRTDEFQSSWLPKLRADRQKADACFAVLVTDSLPEGVESFAMIDGVWVSSWKWAKSLAAALRAALIEVVKTNLPELEPADKSDLVSDYLSTTEFQQRITGTVMPANC